MDSVAPNVSCTIYGSQYDIAVALDIATALLSLIASVFVAATILMFKKYIMFVQRLILYLCMTAGLYSIAIVTRSVTHFVDDQESYNSSTFCICSGFFFQHAGFMFFISLFIVILDMYLRVAKQKDTSRFEIFYLLVIIIGPLSIDWIPFIGSSYGKDGPWCWIRSVNYDANCTTNILGLALRISVGYGPLCIGSVVAILLYILMVRHLYRLKYTGKYDPQKERTRKLLLKEVRPFLIYPWIALFIVLFSFVNRLVSAFVETNQVSWSINAVSGSLQGAIAVIMFGLNFETLRRLLKVKHYPCCCQRKIREYPVDIMDYTDSYEDQDKIAAYTAAMYVCQQEKKTKSMIS